MGLGLGTQFASLFFSKFQKKKNFIFFLNLQFAERFWLSIQDILWLCDFTMLKLLKCIVHKKDHI